MNIQRAQPKWATHGLCRSHMYICTTTYIRGHQLLISFLLCPFAASVSVVHEHISCMYSICVGLTDDGECVCVCVCAHEHSAIVNEIIGVRGCACVARQSKVVVGSRYSKNGHSCNRRTYNKARNTTQAHKRKHDMVAAQCKRAVDWRICGAPNIIRVYHSTSTHTHIPHSLPKPEQHSTHTHIQLIMHRRVALCLPCYTRNISNSECSPCAGRTHAHSAKYE